MPLFEFELAPIAEIRPWGGPDDPSHLSWFDLTVGTFRVNVGEQRLFVYSAEAGRRWGAEEFGADYQIAAFARDVLQPLGAATTRLPPSFEGLVRDAERVNQLRDRTDALAATRSDLHYRAWRWYGERAMTAAYLRQYPDLWFVRVGDEIRVRWDNRGCVAEGFAVWSATHGELALPVDAFVAECQDFVGRLMERMDARLRGLASGELRTRFPVDVPSLREQHQTWQNEFDSYFGPYWGPDIPWAETEAALRALAREAGVELPARNQR